MFLGAIALLQLAIDSVWAGSAGSAHAGGLVAGAAMGGVWVALSRRAVT
jgi:hypothetical protein